MTRKRKSPKGELVRCPKCKNLLAINCNGQYVSQHRGRKIYFSSGMIACEECGELVILSDAIKRLENYFRLC